MSLWIALIEGNFWTQLHLIQVPFCLRSNYLRLVADLWARPDFHHLSGAADSIDDKSQYCSEVSLRQELRKH